MFLLHATKNNLKNRIIIKNTTLLLWRTRLKKILFCIGTRPEAIKMLPLFIKFQKDKSFNCKLLSTGQHAELLNQVLEVFNIKPDYELNIMKQGQDLNHITAKCLLQSIDIFNEFHPDLTFVHGDTSTAFSIGLSCFYNNIPIAHVEAGLRTNQIRSPFPEEFNRKIISNISDLNFAPTKRAVENLKSENIQSTKIFLTGNTIVDSLDHLFEKWEDNITKSQVYKKFKWLIPHINKKKIILVTTHRRENFDEGLKNICKAIFELSNEFIDELMFIFPVHLNPNIKKIVENQLMEINQVKLLQPLNFIEFVYLQNSCDFILSDSGGVQEEAAYLKKPVLVLRDITERQESIDAGIVKLVGNNTNEIINETRKLILDKNHYNSMIAEKNPYGDGQANKRIISITKQYFKIH